MQVLRPPGKPAATADCTLARRYDWMSKWLNRAAIGNRTQHRPEKDHGGPSARQHQPCL